MFATAEAPNPVDDEKLICGTDTYSDPGSTKLTAVTEPFPLTVAVAHSNYTPTAITGWATTKTLTSAAIVAPSNLEALEIGHNSFIIKWQDNTAEDVQYKIALCTAPGCTAGDSDVVATISSTFNSYRLTGLSASSVYNVGVAAINSGNQTAYTQLTGVTTRANDSLYVGVTAGSDFSCGVKSGNAKCWGNGAGGRLGTGTTTSQSVATQVVGMDQGDIVSIKTADTTTCALKTNETLWCWGATANMLGSGAYTSNYTPNQVIAPYGEIGFLQKVKQFSIGVGTVCAISEHDGSRKGYCWGSNSNGLMSSNHTFASNIAYAPMPILYANLTQVTNLNDIAVGYQSMCIIDTSNAIMCSGTASGGITGKVAQNYVEAVDSQPAGTVEKIFLHKGSATLHTSIFDGVNLRIYASGTNGGNKLFGDGTTTSSSVFVELAALLDHDPIHIAGSNQGVCGTFDTDPTASFVGVTKCWGVNSPTWYNLSVSGTTGAIDQTTPNFDAGEAISVNAVHSSTSGTYHSCFAYIDTPARILCGGYDTNQQLGNGASTTTQSSAVRVTW